MNKLFTPILCILTLVSVLLITIPIDTNTESLTVAHNDPSDNVSSSEDVVISMSQASSEPRLSALRVAMLFNNVSKMPVADNSKTIVPIIEQKQPQTAIWLKKLGIIRDDNNTMRLYFKDLRTGSLIRVRTDGTEENGYRLTSTANGTAAIEMPEGLFLLTGEQ